MKILARVAFAFAVGLASAANAAPYKPAFDPRTWGPAVVGPKTQIVTLGSAHLGQLNPKPDKALLIPLLDKLAAWKPTIITHEGLSGEQCDVIQRNPTIYPGVFDDYCWDTSAARKAVGLDFVGARAEAERLLASWPAAPTAAQRRRLAALFVASGDRPSAQVQWLRLAPSERVAGDGVDTPMLSILNRAPTSINESFELAVALAVRLGLEQVYPVDDHTADAIQGRADNGYEAAIQAHWKSVDPATSPLLAKYGMLKASWKTGEELLDYYRGLNTPETQRVFIEFDFKRALADKSEQRYLRRYVAWYEARNLRMVANIRAAFGNQPGARVLNVVGASHKAYYEAYLEMMSDVELVDIQTVLK